MLRFIVVAAVVVGCGSKGPELVENQLAGFTIGVPGKLVESRANRYTAGSVRAEIAEYPSDPIDIRWVKTTTEDAPTGTREHSLGDQLILVSTAVCDQRAIAIATSLPKKVAKRYHDAVVRSLRCTPKPVEEAPIEIVDLKLRGSYRRTAVPELPYSTITYTDEESNVVISVQARPDARRNHSFDLKREVDKQLEGMAGVEVDAKVIDDLYVAQFSASMDGKAIAGFATAKFCGETAAHAFVIVLAQDTGQRAAALEHIKREVTCLATPR